MIHKNVNLVLTQEELDSPEPITIELNVILGEDQDEEEEIEMITYTINYPKT